MENTRIFDIESYSTISLPDVGAYRYAEDPSTEILCVAWRNRHNRTKLWKPGDPVPNFALDYVTDNIRYGAWNVQFDAEMWKQILTPVFGWPWPGYRYFVDIMACGAYVDLPRKLEHAAKVLGGEEKDKKGHRVMMSLAKPQKAIIDNDDPKRLHTEERLNLLYEYCKQDVKAEAGIGDCLAHLSNTEDYTRYVDHRINARGIKVDLDFVGAAIECAEFLQEDLRSELWNITDEQVEDENKLADIKRFLADRDVMTASLAKDVVSKILEGDIPDDCCRVLELRLALGKSSVAKYKKLEAATCADGRIRGCLAYYGAHTGRWAGRLVQVQNLPRGRMKLKELIEARQAIKDRRFDELSLIYGDDLLTVLSALIRSCFISGEGRELIVSDFSAIEARVGFWFCDDHVGLDIYENRGGKLYEEMAASIYKCPVESVDSFKRQFGKIISLACEYGVGEKTIMNQIEQYKIKGITEPMAKEAKDTYRAKFRITVKTWYALEQACKDACENHHTTYRVKKCKIHHNGKHLRIKLPSGRVLYYRRAHLREKMTPWGEWKMQVHYYGIDSTTKQYTLQSTYGGKIFENVVQAIARDLMSEAIVKAERRKWHPIFTVHDELVLDEKIGTVSLAQLNALMEDLPKWADGLPIGAEGWHGTFYRKD